jgi:eukaryotic-like serine/threonine-protein kinase
MQPSPLEDLDSSISSPETTPELYGCDYREGDLIAGKYLLCQPVGEGGMGSVWHARDIFLSVPVALKVLRRDPFVVGLQREYLAERLAREATTLSAIRHPAVVRVFDFGASSMNDPYLAMELLDGESLGALLARSGPLLPEYAVQILLPVAHGLAAVHDQGVVHRDLKPDNLFLAIDGRIQPKVIDFGLVKLTRAQANRKLTGMGILGTPDYMAPEQALELPNVDERADIWAFCVVLYEAVSGTLPFASLTSAETFCALLRRDPAPLTAIGLDPALWSIIEKGLRKDPAQRWQSMRALGNGLARWLASRGVAVDVTGASLHTEWDILEPSTRLGQDDNLPEAIAVPHRSELRSSTRLRTRPKRQERPDVATVKLRRAPPQGAPFGTVAVRWALSAALMAAITVMPVPVELFNDVLGLFGLPAASEPEVAPRDGYAVRSAEVVQRLLRE